MPELPEVETIRLGLEKYLVGHKIEKVDVRFPRIVTGDTASVTGAKVTGVRRAGKGLIIDLDNDYSIAIHIKLTGQLVYKEVSKVAKVSKVSKVKVIRNVYGELPGKHTHVIFHLDRGGVLYYNDFRRFGWIKIIKTSEVANLPFFKELGPEPPVISQVAGPAARHPHPMSSVANLSLRALDGVPPLASPATLTLDMFGAILSKSSSPVKAVIMDQQKIGGVGNIYANDSLNLAKIDPRKQAKRLSSGEIKKLFDALVEVLKRGLKYGGASELSYVNALGEEGGYQNHFLAYGRDGEKCFNCDGIIKRIKIGGRGTFFCEKCQK